MSVDPIKTSIKNLDQLTDQTEYADLQDKQLEVRYHTRTELEAVIKSAQATYDDPKTSGYVVAKALDQHVKSAAELDDSKNTAQAAIDTADSVFREALLKHGTALRSAGTGEDAAQVPPQMLAVMSGVKTFLDQQSKDIPEESKRKYEALKFDIESERKGYERRTEQWLDLDDQSLHPALRFQEASQQVLDQHDEYNRVIDAINPPRNGLLRKSDSPENILAASVNSKDASPNSVKEAVDNLVSTRQKAYSVKRSWTSGRYRGMKGYKAEKKANDEVRAWMSATRAAVAMADGDTDKYKLVAEVMKSQPWVKEDNWRDERTPEEIDKHHARIKHAVESVLNNRSPLTLPSENQLADIRQRRSAIEDRVKNGTVRELPATRTSNRREGDYDERDPPPPEYKQVADPEERVSLQNSKDGSHFGPPLDPASVRIEIPQQSRDMKDGSYYSPSASGLPSYDDLVNPAAQPRSSLSRSDSTRVVVNGQDDDPIRQDSSSTLSRSVSTRAVVNGQDEDLYLDPGRSSSRERESYEAIRDRIMTQPHTLGDTAQREPNEATTMRHFQRLDAEGLPPDQAQRVRIEILKEHDRRATENLERKVPKTRRLQKSRGVSKETRQIWADTFRKFARSQEVPPHIPEPPVNERDTHREARQNIQHSREIRGRA